MTVYAVQQQMRFDQTSKELVPRFTSINKALRWGAIVYLLSPSANPFNPELVLGDMHEKLVKLAGPTIEFHTDRFGDASDSELEKALNGAKGFIYAAEEDFGIVTVEALAAGAPVIAYGKAGTLDIVTDGETGTLFRRQTVEDVIGAIKRAEKAQFFPSKLQRTAKRFDKTLFITKLRKIVGDIA